MINKIKITIKISAFASHLILTSFFSLTSSEAAYLIYSVGEDGKIFFPTTNEEEYNSIYKTIDTLSWPNNLEGLKTMDINNLPEYVTIRKSGAERNFIEQVIMKINKDIHLLWIPTTLFQMAAVLSPSFYMGKDETDIAPFGEGLRKETSVTEYFNTNKLLIENFPDKYLEIQNNLNDRKEQWELYNTALHITYIKISDYFKSPITFNELSALNQEALDEIFKMEVMCYLHNDFPLYRSSTAIHYIADQSGTLKIALDTMTLGEKRLDTSNPIEIIVDPESPWEAFGLSIANTFLAGYDDPDACTFHIFTKNNSNRGEGNQNLYFLNVNKKRYLEKYKNILFWPKSNPITDLYKMGEKFHPRSAGNKTSNLKIYTYEPSIMIITDACNYKKTTNNFNNKFFSTGTSEIIKRIKENLKNSTNSFKFFKNIRSFIFDENNNHFEEISSLFQIILTEDEKIWKNSQAYKTAEKLNFIETLEYLYSNYTTIENGEIKLDKIEIKSYFDDIININNKNIEDHNKKLEEGIKSSFTEKKNEIEINYLMCNFLYDSIKVIHDGKNIIKHQLNENQHPDDELYNNQIELGNLVSENCLKIWKNLITNNLRTELLEQITTSQQMFK